MKRVVIFSILAICAASFAAPVRSLLGADGCELVGKEGVIPVEYLESTGTQYMNLGFKRDDVPNITIEVKFTHCPYLDNYVYDRGLMGWCEGSNGNATGLKVAQDGIWLRDARNSAGTIVINATPPVDIEATLSYNGSVVNGIVISDYRMSLSYSALNYPFGLWCFSSSVDCEPKGAGTNRGIGKGRCHYLRVFSGDSLVHDFRPVRIGSTGYMLDLITGELIGNAGTGDFLIGRDKED